jgi:hypothetical protein
MSQVRTVGKKLKNKTKAELITPKSQDSADGIATGYSLNDRGFEVRVPVRSRIASSQCRLLALGFNKPPIQWTPGAISPEVKRQEHEANQPLPTNIDFKNTRIYTSAPLYAFVA